MRQGRRGDPTEPQEKLRNSVTEIAQYFILKCFCFAPKARCVTFCL